MMPFPTSKAILIGKIAKSRLKRCLNTYIASWNSRHQKNEPAELGLIDGWSRKPKSPTNRTSPTGTNGELPEYLGVFKKGEIVGYHCRNDEIERLQKEIDSPK